MVAGWKCGRSHVAGLTVGGTGRPCCTLGHNTSPPACWKFLACLWSLMHGSKVICYWDWVKCRRTRRLWEADEESVAESGWDETAEWQRVALHLLACTPQLLSRKPAAQAVLLQGTHHHHLLLIERQGRGGDNPRSPETKEASCHQDQTKPHITINSSHNDYKLHLKDNLLNTKTRRRLLQSWVGKLCDLGLIDILLTVFRGWGGFP